MHRVLWILTVAMLMLSGAPLTLGRTFRPRNDDTNPNDAVIQALASRVTMLEAELQAQKQKLQAVEEQRVHKVAFTAYISEVSHGIAVPNNGPLPFNHITLNIGNAYNQNSLSFTAPYDGNYWFYARIDDAHFRSFEMRRNGHGVNRCDNDSVTMSAISCGVVVSLKAGDTVTVNHVELGVTGGVVDPGIESMFSGFLIS